MPFDLTEWSLAWAFVAAPVLARVLGLAWTAPALGMTALGTRIRIGLVLMLTLLLTPVVGFARPAITSADLQVIVLAKTCLAELATGVALGLAMGLILAAARLAGELVGAQAGLNVAGLLAPGGGSGGDSDFDTAGLSPLGRLYGLLALAAFLALDGPLELVGALIESYRVIPIGTLGLDLETVEAAFAKVAGALALSLRAAAPAGLALALAGLALGLLARAAVGLQLLTMSLPLRVGLGLILVIVSLLALGTTFERAWFHALGLL